MTTIEQILDLARWAPSGDNEQPWRFEIIDDIHFVIHGHDTSDWCVYDLDGHASQIAIGALLQTIEIAASGLQLQVEFSRRQDTAANKPTIDAHLTKNSDLKASELLPFIKKRTTQRRPLSTSPLTKQQKQQLENSVGPDYKITWLEGHANRWEMAKLLFRSAHIRLTIPEAYEVHKKNIEWNTQFSEDRIPDQAIGADTSTLKIMRWTLQSWKRVQFMNRYLAGTVLPRIQMDLIPGYLCAAHFCIHSLMHLSSSTEEFISGGKALQRFWLTATQLDLHLQPEMTPTIFSRYSSNSRPFTGNEPAIHRANLIANLLDSTFNTPSTIDNRIFTGRLGQGKEPASRSVRLPLSKLLKLKT